MPILEFDAKHRPWQDQFHRALNFNGLLFQRKKGTPAELAGVPQ
jgi:hypothetical protein